MERDTELSAEDLGMLAKFFKTSAENARRTHAQRDPIRAAAVADQLFKEQVLDVLDSLEDPIERNVVSLRFGLEDGRSRTLVEVGREIGKSKSTVHRIEKRAIEKIKQSKRLNTPDQLI